MRVALLVSGNEAQPSKQCSRAVLKSRGFPIMQPGKEQDEVAKRPKSFASTNIHRAGHRRGGRMERQPGQSMGFKDEGGRFLGRFSIVKYVWSFKKMCSCGD